MKASGFAIAIAAAAATITTARVAQAGYPTHYAWTTPAAGCQLTSTTTAHTPIFDATYGEVDFVDGDTGTYHLACPITALNYNINPTGFNYTYNDEGTGCAITGTVRYHSRASGTFGTVATATATSSGSAPYLLSVGAGISPAFDVETNFYWVDFAVTRTSASVVYCSVNSATLSIPLF